jgi:hypothetical protein
MVQQQPDEFLAGITGRADDGGSLCFHSAFLFNAKTQKRREKNQLQDSRPSRHGA